MDPTGASVYVTGGAKVKMASGGRGVPPPAFDWETLVNPELKKLDPKSYARLLDGLRARPMAFAWDLKSLGCYTGEKFRLSDFFDRNEHPSIAVPPRRFTAPDEEVVRAATTAQFENDIVSRAPVTSQYATALTVAWKNDLSTGVRSKDRVCSDFRPINSHTKLDRYAMACIEEILERATNRGQNIFTTGDLANGFWQILVDEADRDLTTFWGPNRERFVWNRMPFGLKNAPAFFQRVMDRVFAGVCELYIDDALISDKIPDTAEQPWGTDISVHVDHVFAVLDAAMKNGLTWSAYKFNIGYRQVETLGYRVDGRHYQPLVSHTAAIIDMPVPTDKQGVQRFLGLLNPYRKFLGKDLSRITTPLRLLTGTERFSWGPAQQKSFDEVKSLVTTAPVLRTVQRDLPFTLATDWSIEGCGAVLSQEFPDGIHPVAFASRSNGESERKYPSFKGEMCAAVWACEHFRYNLLGRSFILITDHQPLAYLMKSPNLTGVYARWALRLQEFDLTIQYRPGSTNYVADCLSRNPLPTCDEHWERYHDGLDYFAAPDPAESQASVNVVAATLPAGPRIVRDVWDSPTLLDYVRYGELPTLLSENSIRNLKLRARGLVTEDDPSAPMGYRLYTLLVCRGRRIEIPHPTVRFDLTLKTHRMILHLGRRRTHDALQLRYYWVNMHADVAYVLSRCPTCALSRTVFNQEHPSLSPLPAVQPGFRVHVDLAGPFPESYQGMTYILLMVDAGTRLADVVPLPNKTAATVSLAFMQNWVCRYGAPAIVASDGGSEFEGSFDNVLRSTFVDHRVSSPSHPQSNGAVEKLVGVVKGQLIRAIYDTESRDKRNWTSFLPWAVMGYNFTVQSSLRFSPFQLMFAREPRFPNEIAEVFDEPLDWETAFSDPPPPAAVRRSLIERANLLRSYAPVALANLQIAQHRQELWYARRRDGTYTIPVPEWFRPGQFVTTQFLHGVTNLELRANSAQRVLYVRPNGMLVLQGFDGSWFSDNGAFWAPLLDSVLETTYVDRDRALMRDNSESDFHLACPVCSSADSEHDAWVMDPSRSYDTVICDWCQNMHHCACVGLPVAERDRLEAWYCPTCTQFAAPPHVVNRPI